MLSVHALAGASPEQNRDNKRDNKRFLKEVNGVF